MQFLRHQLSKSLVRDILEWNVYGWWPALKYWNENLDHCKEGLRVLELGGRNGGVSLYFALKGHSVVCSDLKGPTTRARELHSRFNVSNLIEYQSIDAQSIPFPDHSFDIVVFKSVFGGIGYFAGKDGQQKAAREIFRVLKPDGKLFFAENLRGSRVHVFLRKWLIRNRGYQGTWVYPSRTDLLDLFSSFKTCTYKVSGVVAPLAQNNLQGWLFQFLDRPLSWLLREDSRVIMYGIADRGLDPSASIKNQVDC